MKIIQKKIQRGFRAHRDWEQALANIHFVMVGTTHPGNIGAVARILKNTAIKNLVLVSAVDSGPHTDALPRASGAYDLVESASRKDSLTEALENMIMTVGTSGRLGGKRVASAPDQVIPELMQQAQIGPVAVVFGRESRGLTNEELKICTHQMIIPTDFAFASMNVAHAAAITGYEIFKLAAKPIGFQAKKKCAASIKAKEEMFEHIQSVLLEAGFLEAGNPLRMMRDIRRILNSADMDDRDVTIIRGIFRKMGNAVRTARERKANES